MENARTRQDAEAFFDAWKVKITPEVEAHFQPILTAFENWHDEIFAYFDHPITNAYTESLNSLIRVINRNGRGYSFEALRAKVLYTEGTHRQASHRVVSKGRNVHIGMSLDAGYGLPPIKSQAKRITAPSFRIWFDAGERRERLRNQSGHIIRSTAWPASKSINFSGYPFFHGGCRRSRARCADGAGKACARA